eukprot:TRINITY_DN1053_c0_g2_i2.p1 TRINITY_DN1053_c0_g2~~TRINITY_DN1053_c0_g2_i2.p1  ORF type:complete len:236 (+),score=51.67 TRINITY_DN1053_c0_g2_i2:294-1001(+)
MNLALSAPKDYIISAKWLKPYIQILTARPLCRFIKASLSALQRFLLAKSSLAQEAFTERVLNELLLVLINCKFDEVDLHDTYKTSVLILTTLTTILGHKAASKLRQDTVIALMNYLEDESQLEGVSELVKTSMRSIIKCIFEGEMEEGVEEVQLALFSQVCSATECLCLTRESLKSSSDYKLRMQSIGSLNSNLSLIYLMINFASSCLSETTPLLASISAKLCPLLHQALFATNP